MISLQYNNMLSQVLDDNLGYFRRRRRLVIVIILLFFSTFFMWSIPKAHAESNVSVPLICLSDTEFKDFLTGSARLVRVEKLLMFSKTGEPGVFGFFVTEDEKVGTGYWIASQTEICFVGFAQSNEKGI